MELLLHTEHLKKYYGRSPVVGAVDDVSLDIWQGRSLALIGESGSGKTTFGKLAARLENPTEGRIVFMGREIQNLTESEFRQMRRHVQIIFQSSGGVFDPSYNIGDSIREVLQNFEKCSRAEAEDRIDEALEKAGLDPALKNRYARQLSGGQCQRANIARALVLRPKLVICDEPVSSLDYSIRKQMLNLLNEIQQKNDVTYLLITHDLSNVAYVCSTVAILYQGKVVEYLEETDRIGDRVCHPYSRQLFASIPAANPRLRTIEQEDEGEIALPVSGQAGCPYADRCPECRAMCREEAPAMKEAGKGHMVACHSR